MSQMPVAPLTASRNNKSEIRSDPEERRAYLGEETA